ncbi:hypothetical protein PIB30_100762 [Stylosanthes scabra]|uniref:Uncharacterized protein n=1 Tax=Stylosanthes scabra TaxID=79078 RepID=A0ABU6YW78_9FABA|nr:hypothetical protein [Stylosanthes scabra]
MASSSSISVIDNHRFKSAFNEELYNSIVKSKKVIAECCIDLDEDEYPEVKEQISLRGWRELAAPKQEISIDLIHEFYANAILTEEEMEEAGGHTFSSYVGGKVVDFSPENLRNVMRFRAQVQGAATDFETRKENDHIETQLQNMMWYQQQALENMSKNQAEYMAELRDIKGKQQELYENNNRFYNQAESATRFGRIKLANPNLVEMSSQKIVKQIYDNIDHKRPMFKGLLKSDLQPSDPTQPPSSSKDPKDPPSSSKDQKDPPK